MQKSLFEGNGVTSLGSVAVESLNTKGENNTNPPPNEDCCSCCGRPQSELTAFEGGYFFCGCKRSAAPYNSLLTKIYGEFFDNCTTDEDHQKAEEKLILKYGEKRAMKMIVLVNFMCIGNSWECRDCISRDDYEYDERIADSYCWSIRCDCCGKYCSELKPFTKGDPVLEYFNGKPLARRYRPDAPPTEGVNKMMDEFFGNCITSEDYNEAQGKLVQEYGKEEAFKIWTFAFVIDDLFKRSWECKDCIVLDTAQYFQKKIAQE